MKEARGNLFALKGWDAICITTNGFVKKNGEAVMGKGCAAEAARFFPSLPQALGKARTERGWLGLIVFYGFRVNGAALVAFPVKPVRTLVLQDKSNIVKHMQRQFESGDIVPGWAAVASLEIIRQSALELVGYADLHEWKKVALPRPGCGAGELDWNDVKPTLASLLDDRFTCFTYGGDR